MANIRAIRARIKSVESTRQITASMKMVSTSKLHRVQGRMTALRPYAESCRTMLERVSAGSPGSGISFLTPREIKKTCFVIIVGNRGLCGMYNTALLHHAEYLMRSCDHECFAVVCGRWGKDRFKEAGIEPVRVFDALPDAPAEADSDEITNYLKELYLNGEADEVVLVYQQFVSVLSQQPGEKRLLPVMPETTGGEGPDYIFEPDRKTVLESLCQLTVDTGVYSALLEAKAGEHAARLTAMTSATDNTDELISDLSLQLNHARQAAITTELAEIIGGASALSNKQQ